MTGEEAPASRARAALHGALSGLVAGTCWALVEAAINWAAGSVAPVRAIGVIALLDLGIAAGTGAFLAFSWPTIGPSRLAVALTLAYGLLRVIEPPGPGLELLYLALTPIALAIGARLVADDDRPVLRFVHVVLLGALGLVLLDWWRELTHSDAPRLAGMLFGSMGSGLVAIAADRLLSLLVRARPRRLALEVVLGVGALVVWGRPLNTAPLLDPIVTGVPPPAGTPDVILVSWDTTRADHLSTYGYGRETSPRLTEFARDARLFRNARSTAGWTLPGHASMLTGLYPATHGARLSGSFLGTESIDGRRNVAYPLAPEHTTLAEMLRDRGYQTGGFVGNYAYLYRDYGLSQGFGIYDDAPGCMLRIRPAALSVVHHFVPGFYVKTYRSANETNARAFSWLDHAPAGRPVFLFINYMDPHHPWYAEPPFDRWTRNMPSVRWIATKNLYTHAVKPIAKSDAAYIEGAYDGQLAFTDHALGELLDGLRARGRYENALIIMTADHGELIGDHGIMGHMGRMLYEPLLHIPMVVKYPGAGRPRDVVDDPVQLVDIVPTVAQVTGAKLSPEVEGNPLDSAERHPIFAEEWINPYLVKGFGETYNRTIRVVIEGGYKLIATSRGERMLFDLDRDPGEEHDLAATEPERVEHLAAVLERRDGLHVAQRHAGDREGEVHGLP
jgi:arylsulfatase A-like enzyme